MRAVHTFQFSAELPIALDCLLGSVPKLLINDWWCHIICHCIGCVLWIRLIGVTQCVAGNAVVILAPRCLVNFLFHFRVPALPYAAPAIDRVAQYAKDLWP